MLLAALFFAGGIIVGAYCWRPASWWLVAAAAFLAAAAYLTRRTTRLSAHMSHLVVLLAMAALGALAVQSRDASSTGPDLAPYCRGDEVTIVGHIAHEGGIRPGAGGLRQVLDLESETLDAGAGPMPLVATIRLSAYSKRAFAESDAESSVAALSTLFQYGQRLRFATRLREPHNFGNPGAFDYRGYLAREGVAALGSISAEKVEVLPGFAGTRLAAWRSRARQSVIVRIDRLWGAERGALINAMLVGDKSQLGRSTNLLFQRTGAYHILVVSGINVGILAAPLLWLLRRLRVAEAIAGTSTLLLACAYAYLADAGAPIMRATLMLALFLGARLLYRERSILNAVGAAALGLLALDPRAVFDASFQLTFICVLVIAGIAVPLMQRTSEKVRRRCAIWIRRLTISRCRREWSSFASTCACSAAAWASS
ncbi:MAG TPA: ComEC family competence protein [Chloroflexota bacterium]|nr:ComEC family competence protein [Chloroflexota bacterium]